MQLVIIPKSEIITGHHSANSEVMTLNMKIHIHGNNYLRIWIGGIIGKSAAAAKPIIINPETFIVNYNFTFVIFLQFTNRGILPKGFFRPQKDKQ